MLVVKGSNFVHSSMGCSSCKNTFVGASNLQMTT